MFFQIGRDKGLQLSCESFVDENLVSSFFKVLQSLFEGIQFLVY